jgi:thioredoxin-related protein
MTNIPITLLQNSSFIIHNLLPVFVIICCFAVAAFTYKQTAPKPRAVEEKVKWMSWQEASEANKTKPKKILVDVYTSWCGWCKVMDKQTFTNDTITEYLNKYYYCVKLDAEGRDTIRFDNKDFVFISPENGGGRNGIHTLAYALLDGKMGFPSLVYLTEKYERSAISPGYKTPAQLLPELRFTAEEAFKNKTFENFMKENEKK